MISIHAAFFGKTTCPGFQKSCQMVLIMSTTLNSRLCKQKKHICVELHRTYSTNAASWHQEDKPVWRSLKTGCVCCVSCRYLSWESNCRWLMFQMAGGAKVSVRHAEGLKRVWLVTSIWWQWLMPLVCVCVCVSRVTSLGAASQDVALAWSPSPCKASQSWRGFVYRTWPSKDSCGITTWAATSPSLNVLMHTHTLSLSLSHTHTHTHTCKVIAHFLIRPNLKRVMACLAETAKWQKAFLSLFVITCVELFPFLCNNVMVMIACN